jgi:hypothetical protein
MAWYDNLIGGTTGNLIAGIGGAAAQQQIIKDIEALGKRDVAAVFGQETVPQYEGGILGEISRRSEFKPFTVTTPTGSRATLGAGGMDTMLSPTEQLLQSRLLGFGSEAFNFLNDPTARRKNKRPLLGC